MVFTENSYLVKFYVDRIDEGLDRNEVPELFNLRDMVYSIRPLID